MTADQIAAFLVFAVVAAGTPGPANVLLTATGANAGVVRGLPCLFGVAIGTASLLALSAFGLGALVGENPTMLRALNWAGGLLLLWLAWKIATSGRSDAEDAGDPIGFTAAAALQWVNPKAWMVSVSAAGAHLHGGAGALAHAAMLGGLFVLAALPACFVWLAFGAGMRRLLTSDRNLRAFNVAMGALLAGSILFIVV